MKNAQFLLARQYFCVQNIKISFEYADFYAKISLILDTAARNSITQRALLVTLYVFTVTIYLTSSRTQAIN